MEQLFDFMCPGGVLDAYTFIRLFIVMSICEMFGAIVGSVMEAVR